MVESNLSTKVELFFSARNLLNKDIFSKSDPYCVVSMLSPPSNKYFEVGRTEVIQDNLNPNWSKSVICDFFFETKQPLMISVLDYDQTTSEHLGDVFITLGEIVAKGTSILDLTQKGKVIVRVEEVKKATDNYEFHIRGIKLDKKDWFGKSDPYLIFYRSLTNNSWSEVYRTEIVKNTLDPIWKPIHISGQKLCNGDAHRPIKIECYDWDMVGSHDLIGVCQTDLNFLSEKGGVLELKHPEKHKKKGNAGTIELTEVRKKKVLSFIDYLRVGVQISFSIAIDFTGSNGEYSSPTSLHHVNPSVPNQYEKAIWEVGSILEAYDHDKMFPVYGFGGVPRGESTANHAFPLTFNHSDPFVHGAAGVLDIYRRALSMVSLSGPTYFHHIIEHVALLAREHPPHEVYTVLLILTDGAIMDMDQTKSSIVEASRLPMSIIIVGVGNADFSSMEALDCDDGLLFDNRGVKAVRDIVQFVPFHHFGGNPVALAAEVLKEVPKQLTDFMVSINYAPEVPLQTPIENLAPVEINYPQHYQNNLMPLDVPNLPEYQNIESVDPEYVPEYIQPSAPEYVPEN